MNRSYIALFVPRAERTSASALFVSLSAIGMALGPLLALPLSHFPELSAFGLTFNKARLLTARASHAGQASGKAAALWAGPAAGRNQNLPLGVQRLLALHVPLAWLRRGRGAADDGRLDHERGLAGLPAGGRPVL